MPELIMLIVNILFLVVISFFMGYFLGKGKIEIIKKVMLTKEQEEQMKEADARQQKAIDDYNAFIDNLTRG